MPVISLLLTWMMDDRVVALLVVDAIVLSVASVVAILVVDADVATLASPTSV